MHRVLFVDDEPSILKSVQRMVRSYSLEAETETAGSAREALERVGRGDIDVVVSDVRMPGMDGIELLTRLKADLATQQIPVIMLTGDGDASVKNIALDLGAAEFINKPADPTELCARLRNVLRLKAFQDQLVTQNDVLSAQIIQAQKMEIAGILASQVAHDLNNILGAIVGNTELALYKIKDSGVDPDLQKVIAAAQHAAGLVRRIRDLGRIKTDEADVCDPTAVVNEVLDMLQVMVPKGVTVVWDNPQLKLLVPVDATSLHQVVMNLVVNALQAVGESGALTVKVIDRPLDFEEAALRGVAEGRFTVIEVSDTGAGIDADVLPRIFDPFFTTKGEGAGTGIGLSVVDRVIRSRGGFVVVDSTPGKGASFRVHLPIEESVRKDAVTPAEAAR